MRTKSLVLTALLGVATLASTATAQVYSVNAVGFVNVTVPANEFKMIGNPLNNGDNKLPTIMPVAPINTKFYKFVDGAYQIFTFRAAGWSGTGDMTINPGQGGFIKHTDANPYVFTFVGEVPQGQLSVTLNPNFTIASSLVPQSLPLATTDGTPSLEFPVANNDKIYFFRSGAYDIYTFRSANGWASGRIPIPEVGEAFWVQKALGATWSRTFSVNP